MSLIVAVIAIVLILVWATTGLMAIDQTMSKIKITFDAGSAAIIFGAVGISFAIWGFYYVHVWHKIEESLFKELVSDFYGNVALTCIGITCTVLIIDRLNSRRILEQRKQEIIEEMESPVRDVAVEAVRLARKHGWLDEALKKASLAKAELAGANLSSAHLRGMHLWNVRLQEADLSKANLRAALLADSQLQGAQLQGANLQIADLFRAQLQWANLTDAQMQEVQLVGANLQGAILWKTQMQGAHLETAHLQKAMMSETNLEGANLSCAHLEGALITKVNLKKVKLLNANLKGAHLWETQLQDARYNRNTIWPDGFDPKAAGAILVEDGEI